VNGHRVEIALRACADGQLVFTALAGQQRPAASVRDAGPGVGRLPLRSVGPFSPYPSKLARCQNGPLGLE
jgi:hypothetical protein